MTSQSVRSLPELLSFIVDNRGRTCPTSDVGIPLIATNCLKEGKREAVFENIRYVDERTHATWFRAHPKPGDILFVCKGSPGRVAVVPDPVPYCIAQDMVALRANPAAVDAEYLYYRLRSPDVRTSIANMHVGTMIPHFKKGDFGKLRFAVHDSISEQRSIAEVLRSLDDKITASGHILRRTLDLADAKFSGAVEGVQLGNTTFDDLANVGGGGTPKTSVDEYWNGDISWATPTDVTGLDGPYIFSTGRTITQDGLNSCASKLYPKGSILMTSRATIGAFALAQCPIAVNQGFIVVNAKEPTYQLWLFHEMRARVSEFISHANGATFLELSRGRFKKFKVRVPETRLVLDFSREAEALHALASQVMAESVKLAKVRDELLPLLMSGKVRVRDAENVVEGVV